MSFHNQIFWRQKEFRTGAELSWVGCLVVQEEIQMIFKIQNLIRLVLFIFWIIKMYGLNAKGSYLAQIKYIIWDSKRNSKSSYLLYYFIVIIFKQNLVGEKVQLYVLASAVT